MGCVEHEQHGWLIEPLLAAGVPLDEIRTLVFRLAFEGVVGVDACADQLVRDQPASVRAAWHEVIERMLVVGGPTAAAGAGR